MFEYMRPIKNCHCGIVQKTQNYQYLKTKDRKKHLGPRPIFSSILLNTNDSSTTIRCSDRLRHLDIKGESKIPSYHYKIMNSKYCINNSLCLNYKTKFYVTQFILAYIYII